jgi:uncharacterized protein YdhG (YjbR/CyaY superfamily)
MLSQVKDIDSYIESQPENVRDVLHQLRQTVKKTVPDAEELISYNMPAFRYHGMLVWFAAFNKHYSIFVRRHILNLYIEELKQFELSESRSAIKIPLDKPVPVQLLTKILKTGSQSNKENEKLKSIGKKQVK